MRVRLPVGPRRCLERLARFGPQDTEGGIVFRIATCCLAAYLDRRQQLCQRPNMERDFQLLISLNRQ